MIHGIVAFLDAYGIGANDVANSFGTSVGSKTLKLWSAVVIAAIFEFLGALLLGGAVTRTIAGNIARVTTFRRYPAQFMFGEWCCRCDDTPSPLCPLLPWCNPFLAPVLVFSGVFC